MAKIVYKLIVSIMDNNTIELSGIPNDMETALQLVHDVNRTIVRFLVEKAKSPIILEANMETEKLVRLN